MAQNTKEELDKAIAGMNKGIDKKEEMKLMMEPYANWDNFLTPAPLSIALLGQLILVSSDADFSLEAKKDGIKFEFLKYPDSFRACLVQVSNKGWDAFNKAHTSMDQIRLYSSNVDHHVKTAVKFLIAGSAEDVQSMVPDALKNIDVIADECLELATSVEEEFVAVMKLIAELLEACARAKGQHEHDLKAAKIAREVVEEHMKAFQAEKEQALSRQDEMEKQMKEANEEFQDSIKSMPGAWDIIGKACADTMISATRTIVTIPRMMFGRLGSNTRSSQESHVNKPTTDSNRPQHFEGALAIHKMVREVYGLVKTLVTLAHGGKVMKGDKDANYGVLRAKKALEIIKKNRLEEVNESLMKTKVLILCEYAIDLSQTLSKKPKLQYSQEEIDKINLEADMLLEKADALLAGSYSVLGNNALPSTSPNLAEQPVYNSDGGLVQQALDSYRFRTETAKEMLKDSRRAYEASCDEAAKKTREVTKLLVEMKELDLKEIDMEKIKETLVKGIEALGELREQWGKLVQFFQMLSSLVKCCLSTSLKNFAKTCGGSYSVLGNNALPSTSPNLAEQPVYNSDGGLVQQALDSYRFRTETAKEMLKDSRRAYEASCDEAAKKTREVTKLLVEMKELDLKEIDMEKIKETLVKGIEALGELREQWGKLVQFFQMLSSLVKCCLSTSLKNFAKTCGNRLAQGDSGMSAVMRDTIFEQAFKANQIAYVVNGISSVYVEVSNKHLMERITCLGKLIALDPASNSHEIMLKREELNQGCKEAQEAIRRIALNKKKEITEAFDKRIGRIESEVEVLLPPISEKRAEEIKEKVKSNIAIAKADIGAKVDALT